MSSYFLGGDASKGYCNFTLLDHIKVARLNPYGVKYHKKASLDRIETDKISARKIADYLITYPDKVEYNKEDFFAELRRCWKYTRMLKKQKAQLQTHLKAQLYVSQPQVLVYCKEGMPDWIFLLLKKYPTAMDLAKARVNKLALIPYITKERAKELISEAKRSVASMKSPIMGNIIKSAAREILNMQKTIDEQVKLMLSTYGMLKHKQRYDPNVDRANRKKVIKTIKTKQETEKIDKSRRYQPYDKNAPVSKRQAKKRELTEVVEVVTQNGTSSQVTRYPKENRTEE